MLGRPFSATGVSRTGVFIILLFLTACSPLPNDEAAWLLEDLAAEERPSRLKAHTPEPARRSLAYVIQGARLSG